MRIFYQKQIYNQSEDKIKQQSHGHYKHVQI